MMIFVSKQSPHLEQAGLARQAASGKPRLSLRARSTSCPGRLMRFPSSSPRPSLRFTVRARCLSACCLTLRWPARDFLFQPGFRIPHHGRHFVQSPEQHLIYNPFQCSHASCLRAGRGHTARSIDRRRTASSSASAIARHAVREISPPAIQNPPMIASSGTDASVSATVVARGGLLSRISHS